MTNINNTRKEKLIAGIIEGLNIIIAEKPSFTPNAVDVKWVSVQFENGLYNHHLLSNLYNHIETITITDRRHNLLVKLVGERVTQSFGLKFRVGKLDGITLELYYGSYGKTFKDPDAGYFAFIKEKDTYTRII